MRNIYKTLFVTLLFVSQTALADEGYQMETTLSHDRYKSDSGYKSNDNNLGVTYYFSKVDAKTFPLQEAGFMARSSGIGVDYSNGSIESGGIKADPTSFGLNAFYANPNHPYVIGGSVSESELDSGSGFVGSESKSYSISPGYYLRDNLLVSASLVKSETDYTGGGTFDSDSASLTTKWLHVLPSGKTYNFVAGVARSNYDSTFSGNSHATSVFISSDYYITRSFSVGGLVALSNSSVSNGDVTSYGLTTSWFITPSLFAKLSGIKYNQDIDDSDNVSLALGMRF